MCTNLWGAVLAPSGSMITGGSELAREEAVRFEFLSVGRNIAFASKLAPTEDLGSCVALSLKSESATQSHSSPPDAKLRSGWGGRG